VVLRPGMEIREPAGAARDQSQRIHLKNQ
jgi:hypothetical protein